MADKADMPLLQIAEETGLPIITGDRFVGHRREFPWLDGEPVIVGRTAEGIDLSSFLGTRTASA